MSDSLLHSKLLLLLHLSLLILWNSVSVLSASIDAIERLAPGPSPNNSADDPTKYELLQAEVSSLKSLIYHFKTKQIEGVTASYCGNTKSSYGYSIECNDECYDKNKRSDSEEPCHISNITFSGFGLMGTIDAALGDLTSLKSVSLANNKLRGPIPDIFRTLTLLVTLDLSNNELSGPIPESIGSLKSLKWLYLRYNSLTGSIPPSMGQLKNLEQLYLDYNLLSGNIPRTLGYLWSLKILNIGENKLSGQLPSSLSNLEYLTELLLPSNILIGEIPNSYKNLKYLRIFEVAGNMLSGQLPSFVDNWRYLEVLGLQGNCFSGPLPKAYFESLYNLESLLISDLIDTADVKFPDIDTIYLPNIHRIVLRNCSLTGPALDKIGKLTTLKHLDLSFNRLEGSLPTSISPNFIYLSLTRNKFSGAIPDWIFQSSAGTRMDLSYNKFSVNTPIPADLDLNLFACCCCEVSRDIKPHMLQPVDMMNFYFPKKKPKFSSLYINSGGQQTIFNKTHYEADDDTSNFHISPEKNWAYTISGDFLAVTANSSDYTQIVPCKISNSASSLYDDARLSPVSLNYYGFSLYPGRYNVTLHFAEIVYVKDDDYNHLRKRVFDIYIQGNSVIKDFNIKDQAMTASAATTLNFEIEVAEGHHLLDIHLYWRGKGSFANSPAFNGPLISAVSVDPLFKVRDGKLTPWQIALIAVASLVFALLLFLALAWSMGWLEDKELLAQVKVGEYLEGDVRKDNEVALKKIVEETKNFSQGQIGKAGSLGSVYKAKVGEKPDIIVAVKKLRPELKGKFRDPIGKEIRHLITLKHDNVIKLWDYYIGDKHQLLIYEYMEKESLDTALFGKHVGIILWENRMSICMGIATGLKYLHETKIVHGKIKAANILLDEKYNPKLSDFVMASVYTDDVDHFNAIRKEDRRDYFAREYIEGDKATFETDIYSLGVLLIEIVAGRRNKEVAAGKETKELVNEVREHFENDGVHIKDLIDKNFKNDAIEEQATQILEIAVRCTQQAPNLRPNILKVVQDLEHACRKAANDKSLVKVPSPSGEGSGIQKF